MQLNVSTVLDVWEPQAQVGNYFFICTARGKKWEENAIQWSGRDSTEEKIMKLADQRPPEEWDWLSDAWRKFTGRKSGIGTGTLFLSPTTEDSKWMLYQDESCSQT